jgi:hypothetical protein
MMTSQRSNLLLSALPAKTQRKLLAQQEPVSLTLSDSLFEHGQRARHVYFPIDAFVSLLTPGANDGSAALEVALVGNEGMVGNWLSLGVDAAPLRGLVQGGGLAWRVDAKTFRREVAASQDLRDVLDRYLYVQLVQLAQTASCTRFHVVEARLARWLLMTKDRAHSRKFCITHQFLAYMLGVRRAGVTRAAASLKRRNLIRYSRGDLEIVDVRGLEKAACSCYATDRETYYRVLGRRPK